MSIKYKPTEILKRMLAKKKIARLISRDLTLNRAVISTLSDASILTEKTLETTALKVIKSYKKRFKEEINNGLNKQEAINETLNNKKLLINRVQNTALYEISQAIGKEYRGEFYKWLPSSADVPDPEHQLKYGEVFQIGKGEKPGDRYGCKCGMEILVDETKLKL